MSSFTKITHLQSEALQIFYEFVKAVRTASWINGIELGPNTYGKKPSDGSRREVTIWQGSKNSDHQKVTFKFIYSSDHGWCHQGLVFSGVNQGKEWSQAFRFGQNFSEKWFFIPCTLKNGWYPEDYNPDEAQKLLTKWIK